MSTRRSTRNSSAEPVPAAPTPARRRGARTTGLGPDLVGQVPIPSKPSTSYGGTHLPIGPATIARGDTSSNLLKQLTKVKERELEESESEHESEAEEIETPIPQPTRATETGRGRGRGGRGRGRGRPVASTPDIVTPSQDASRTFTEESGLAGIAAIGDDTPLSQPSAHSRSSQVNKNLQSIQEEPQTQAYLQKDINDSIDALSGILGRKTHSRPQAPRLSSPWFENSAQSLQDCCVAVKRFIRSIWSGFCSGAKDVMRSTKASLLVFLLLTTLATTLLGLAYRPDPDLGFIDSLRYDISDAVFQVFDRPLSHFRSDEYNSLHSRVSALESDFRKLTHHKELVSASIKRLEDNLPSAMLFSVDNKGDPVIDDGFWRALLARMKKEGMAGSDEDYGVSSAIEEVGKDAFADWITKNEAKIKIWQGSSGRDVVHQHIEEAMKTQLLMAREDVVALLREQFSELRQDLKEEQARLVKEYEQHRPHHGAKYPVAADRAVGYSREEIKAIAIDALNRIVPTSQLAALAKVKLDKNVADTMRRVNLFSPKSGAVVNVKLSSTTFEFFRKRTTFMVRLSLWAMGRTGPVPNSPATALIRWEEAGDCWCATKSPEGSTDLAVLIKPTYPDEIVIEHIHPSATLNPGSTPTKFEVLAELDSWDAVMAIDSMSKRLYPDRVDRRDDEFQRQKWVVIGQFYYDAEAAGVQAFKLDVDLKGFNAPTGQLIVRTLGNVGSDQTCLYRVKMHGELA